MNSPGEDLKVTMASRVRICDNVLFQELQDEAVLLNLDTGEYFGLDSVGTRIWRELGTRELLSEVAAAILAEFEVDAAKCESDLLKLIDEMEKQGLVRVSL